MTDLNAKYVSLADIEHRAHALRAEAAREMAQSVAAWFRGLFHGHAAGKHA